MNDEMNEKTELGTAVCVFCEHCVASNGDYNESCESNYFCKLLEHKRVVHPVTGLPTYMYRDPREWTDNEYSLTDMRYAPCHALNKLGHCKNFKQISEKERHKRLGSKEKIDERIFTATEAHHFDKDLKSVWMKRF